MEKHNLAVGCAEGTPPLRPVQRSITCLCNRAAPPVNA